MSSSRRFLLLRLTREGKIFTLLIFAVGFGALNTGNNLLYLLLSAMISLIFLSILFADFSLRGIHLERSPPPQLFAGSEVLVSLQVHNLKKRLPSFHLSIRETFGKGRFLPPVTILHLPPRGSQRGEYHCVFPRRGRCQFRGWKVETTFPFGLISRGRIIDGTAQALIFPKKLDVSPPLEVWGVGQGFHPSGRAGNSEEFFSLRPYRQGDDRRKIAWKASARRGVTLLRESEAQGTEGIELILLDVGAPLRSDPLLEFAIEQTASLAEFYLAEGHEVALHTLKQHLPYARGQGQHNAILSTLALLKHSTKEAPNLNELLHSIPSPQQRARRILISTPSAQALAPLIEGVDTHILVEHLPKASPEPNIHSL